MRRHPFRWESLTFGLFFLALVGNWAVWKADLLTARELSLTASAVLIVLGVIGVAATLWHARPTPAPTTSTPTRGNDDEQDADPQP